jgi:hypothetical protein
VTPLDLGSCFNVLLLLGYPGLATEHEQPLVQNGNGWERPLAHGPPVHHPNQVTPLDLGSCSAEPMLGRIPDVA